MTSLDASGVRASSPVPASPNSSSASSHQQYRILEVSTTEKIATAVLRDDEKLLGGDDKRSCDACKKNAAVEKIIRSNGFISINQFLCA